VERLIDIPFGALNARSTSSIELWFRRTNAVTLYAEPIEETIIESDLEVLFLIGKELLLIKVEGERKPLSSVLVRINGACEGPEAPDTRFIHSNKMFPLGTKLFANPIMSMRLPSNP
jgi:hypothetical protein